MQLAIVHFHLNRGGVTQVIVNHLRSLAAVVSEAERCQVVIFYGGRQEGWPATLVDQLPALAVRLVAVPELEYDDRPVADPDRLAESLVREMQAAGLEPGETVVHIHNHALGKNTSLPGAVVQLAEAGYALLLQIHDFAEDFRPGNYRSLVHAVAGGHPADLPRRLYPQGSAIHYAALNGRDERILAAAGVAAERLHWLPNPVADFGGLPDREQARRKLADRLQVSGDQPYVLYPVRGIRRKNLGELLLWSAVTDHEARFALTLPPLNPLERPRYAAWKQLAAQLRLPLLFEAGGPGGLDFGENLVAADRILTTSVAEGFGMVFLETWLAGRTLIGRDLPEITADFTQSGVTFEHLSAELRVPAEWVRKRDFADELRHYYAGVLEAYGWTPPGAEEYGALVSPLWQDDLLDFARCSARLQESIVSRAARDRGCREMLRQLNPVLNVPLEGQPETMVERTERNAQAVRRHYSLESSGMRLLKLYQAVVESPRHALHDLARGASILDAFLSLQRFHPIRID